MKHMLNNNSETFHDRESFDKYRTDGSTYADINDQDQSPDLSDPDALRNN